MQSVVVVDWMSMRLPCLVALRDNCTPNRVWHDHNYPLVSCRKLINGRNNKQMVMLNTQKLAIKGNYQQILGQIDRSSQNDQDILRGLY